jgi:hypothetical protein
VLAAAAAGRRSTRVPLTPQQDMVVDGHRSFDEIARERGYVYCPQAAAAALAAVAAGKTGAGGEAAVAAGGSGGAGAGGGGARGGQQ